MIKNYLNKHTNVSISRKGKAFLAVLSCLNAGKKSLFVSLIISLISIFPDQLFGQCSPMTSGTIYTSSCTWTCPAGVSSVTVECWGGGGGAGGSSGSYGGSGGGGGAYSSGTVAVTPGTPYTVTVGGGGAGGTNSSTSGSAGGDSWFSTNTTVMAKGGGGGGPSSGALGAGGDAAAGYGTTKYSGGTGGDGHSTGGGGGGSSAGTGSNGNNASGGTAGSAVTGGGAGGTGNTSAQAGSAPGGGGGGADDIDGYDGAAGARGQVKLTFCTAPGDPTVFGVNEWKVYVWNAGDGLGGGGSWSTNYSGYYVIPTVLSFDTRTGQTNSTAQSWDPNGTPSSASGYSGCTVGSDNHSYSIKRQGFPCGKYEIKLINDDRAELYIDGALVNTQAGWNSAYTGVVWTGDLGASTTIEYKISEAGGGSNAGLEFTNISTQATTFVPSSITATTMTLGWTRGNGTTGVLVVAKAGSAPTDPTTGVAYTGNAAYGSGTAVGGGYAVYSGTGTSVNLTGLTAGTTYYFAAYEYNASSCYTNSMVELTGNATTSAPYKATFTGMSTGSANWCAGEVRNVTVTVTNSGTSTWTDAAPDVNIGCKWNYMADYDYRVNAGGLAAGASATYTFTVTAPSAGSENLRFDVVKEGDCWFANNNGSCGQGNSYSTSSAITISAPPATPAPITASTTTVTCGSTLALASAAPTGGTITTSGGYRIHTFTSSGTFTTPSGFTPGTVEALVVAGGGGGGGNGGGGGGAGGLTYNSASSVAANTGYAVTVGAGGAAGNSTTKGSNGANSVFNGITTTGGGGGASRDGGGACVSGGSGGGGGGASSGNTAGATAGAGTGGQGTAGQNGTASDLGCNAAGGGGGGAGAQGTAGASTVGGNGGVGLSYSISGSAVYYAGGGAGGVTCTDATRGTGGNGGGGNGGGSSTAATAGTANRGGGGGGGGQTAAAAGGSGVVIIRYPDVSAGTWTSSNTSVATVNPVNGVVTGVAAGSSTISYSYTNPGGCSSAAVTYVVTVPGVPSAVTASASPNPVCTGSTLTLTGGATHATGWGWTGPNSYTATSQSPTVSTNVTTAMAGTYSLIATNACGSSAPATTAAVAVTTLPAATISYAGSPFCISVGAGQAVTRTGTAGGTYSSTAGLTIDGTTGAINPSTSTAGVYTVTYTIAAASGCAQVTATTSVTIKALPAITGQPASPAAINAGAGTAVFTVTATGGSLTYQWEADDGGWHSIANGAIYSGVTTASLSVINPPGSYNGRKFRCVVSGCAPSVTSDGLATLTVNTLGNQEPCYGTVQNYNVTNVAGVTYTWTYPAGWSVVSGQGTNSINLNVGVSSGNVSVTPSTCGGNGTARTLAVTVASVSIASSDADNVICSGESVTFTATPANAGTPTYQWTKNGVDIAGETASTYVSTTLANTDAIAVKMTSSSGCLITSSPINMVVNPASLTASVTISASETNICSGVSVTFTAVPVNGGLTPSYQWKIDGGNVGTNSSTYTSTTLANNNSVTVVMTNSEACILGSPATSNAIVMTVNTSLVASVSIAEDVNNICAGTGVTLTATPTNGGTPAYQWKNGAANVGTNSNTYTSTTFANNDAITVVMTTSLPCTTPSPVTSNIVTMNVNTPIVNNIVSAAQVICTGSTPAALTGTVPTGGNGAYTYLWEQSTTSSTTGFAAAAGTNTNSGYSPGALTATTWYRRTVTSAPCSDNVSAAIEITVNTAIVNNTVSTAQSICSGSTPTPIAGSVPTGGNGVYTYSWEVSTTSSTAGFAAIGGATSQDYSPGALVADTWYRRTATSAPCASSVSPAIGITINPNLPASVTVAASATTVCNGTSVVFTPTPTNGGTSPTYQWQNRGVNISGEVFSTYTTASLADNDTIRVVMTSNAAPCLTGSPATSNGVIMTINEIPLATATNSAQTICSGGGFTTMALGTSNSVTGTTFAWVRDNTADVTGIAASGTGNITGVALTNATSAGITVTFTITPTGPANTNCPGSPITATILVNPAAPAAPGSITGIANTYAGFVEPYSIAAVTNATTYTWTVPAGWTITSGQGTTAIRATAGAAGQNGNITVTASNICGTSTASTIAVTVTANTAAVTTVCEGSSQRYTTQYRDGVTYRWTVPADWTITSGANSNSMTTTFGATSGNVEVIASNSCGDGSVGTLAVTVNLRPVMTNITYTSTCTGVAIDIPLTANPASSYSWVAADNADITGESTTDQSATSIQDVLTNTAAGITTVTYSVTPTSTVGGCVGTAGGVAPQVITVDVNPTGYWTGNVDTKWREPGNWCGIPTCSSDAFIPTSPTGGNFPQIEWPDAICRDLTISTGASLEYVTDGLALCGNWLNNGLFIADDERTTFQGTSNQTVGGIAENYFYDLYISNSGVSGSDNVILTQPATVTHVLNLSNGILNTDATNILTLTNSANTATTPGVAGSFVSGPMRWNGISGAGPFVFPTGKAPTKWARIAVSDLDGAATDFQAEHFKTAWSNIMLADMATSPTPVLKKVSSVEYWHLYRIGASNAKVTLYWENATASGISDCSALKIAHWDPANATNSGGTMGSWENNNDAVTTTGTCGGSASGTITSDLVATEFSPFTFGDTLPNVNPLPVELLYFSATYNGKTVDVTWKTASEINNDYFTVERSIDGVNFITVGMIIPSQARGGNSTSVLAYYLNDDKVAPGVYYYRLKQTDFNGEYQYSNIDEVEIKGDATFSFNISPNPSDGTELNSIITAEKDQEIVIAVYDVLGQEIYSQIIVTEEKGNTMYAINLLQQLSSGVYMITATSNNKVYTKRLVVN